MSQSLKLIIDYGASLGYKEETLRDFVKLQQEIEREERKAERERVKEELDFKRLMEKHDKELQIQQITHQQQMEIMHEKEKLKAVGVDEIQGQGFQSSTLSVPGNSKDNPGENRHQNTNKPFVPKSDRRCYKCNRVGHIASECRPKPKVGMVTTQESPDTQETSPVETEFPAQVSFVNTIPTDTGTNTFVLDSPTTVSPSCYLQQQHNMPLSAGYVEGKPVTVLRDTGCSGIVVRTKKRSQDDEAIVSSAVIDCPEDEDVEEYGLPSVGDKEELSSVDINQELSPQDRQKLSCTGPLILLPFLVPLDTCIYPPEFRFLGLFGPGPEYRTLSSVVYRNGVTCEVQCTSVLTTTISP
uniref:CCHC-type domain-containing protein n=1 Tax=Magallana gigas TaxID=29159 RepID=A0A8W8KH22_MAGGI